MSPSVALHALLQRVADFLDGARPLTPRSTPARLREALARVDFSRPTPPSDVIDALGALLREHTLHAAHPRHMGLFHPPVHDAAVAAEALAAGVDAQLAVWGAAPGAVELERHTLAWVAARFGYATHHGSFTSGASMSHHVAMSLALSAAIPGYARDGLVGCAARPMVYVSREGHGSVEKAARLCGLGDASVRRVRCDPAWRVDLRALREAIAEDRAAGRRPTMVVATAGTTNTGAIDPLGALGDLCAREDLWLHVDAAWAGAAALSPRAAPLLDGVARADSLAWDAHKWLPLPIASGVLLTRHPARCAALFAVDAPYVPRGDAERAMPYRETALWSRRFTGAGLFALLATLGAEGVARWVDEGCARGDALRAAVTDAGWSVVAPVPLPLACFTHERVRRGALAPKRVAAALRREGVAWMSETWLDGRVPALHASVMHPGLTEADLAALTQALRALAAA